MSEWFQKAFSAIVVFLGGPVAIALIAWWLVSLPPFVAIVTTLSGFAVLLLSSSYWESR